MTHEPVKCDDAVIAFAIYASYDGNVPDTSDLILVSSLSLAEELIPIIVERFNNAHVNDGWEWVKSWLIRETVGRRDEVMCSLDAAIAELDDAGYNSDDTEN